MLALQFRPEFTVGDIANVLLFVAAVPTLGFTWWQVRLNTLTQRTQLLKDLYFSFDSNQGLQDAFYEVEYDKFVYGSNFHGSPLERKIDGLLDRFDLICHLFRSGMLSEPEIKPFEYYLRRIYGNPEIQKYLLFLVGFYGQHRKDMKPFPDFREYCASRGYPADREGEKP